MYQKRVRLSFSASISTGLVVFSLNIQNVQADASVSEHVNEARSHAKMLGKTLKSRLQTAIQSGGLTAGITECHLAAEDIAVGLSTEGWEVGRTALKVRNPNNAPDPWELQQLNAFAEQLDQQQPMPIESHSFNEKTGEMRYMMAIPTGQICLACHGIALAPEVEATLQTLYPNDQATGFTLGSLRGAFTVSYTPPPTSN